MASPARLSAPLLHRLLLHRLLPLCLLLILPAGCTPLTYQDISDDGQGRRAVLITGMPAPQEPPLPELKTLTPSQLESSLRKITVKVSTWVSFMYGESGPLFSGAQVLWARNILQERLGALAPGQRIELNMKDRFKGHSIRVETYLDGPHLVYRFRHLVSNEDDIKTAGGGRPLFRAELLAQEGQEIVLDHHSVMLRDDIRPARQESAQALQEKLNLLTDAREKNILSGPEADDMERLIRENSQVGLDSWRLYWEKRSTLSRAYEQGLFSPAELEQRKSLLLTDLGLQAPTP